MGTGDYQLTFQLPSAWAISSLSSSTFDVAAGTRNIVSRSSCPLEKLVKLTHLRPSVIYADTKRCGFVKLNALEFHGCVYLETQRLGYLVPLLVDLRRGRGYPKPERVKGAGKRGGGVFGRRGEGLTP